MTIAWGEHYPQFPFVPSEVEGLLRSPRSTPLESVWQVPAMFWAYILRCADGRFYTGHTDNLERRIGEHQNGGYCDFTSRRRPVSLVWSETFPSRIEALEAERRIKPWSRRKKEALIAGDWAALSYWARPPMERDLAPFAPSKVDGPEAHVAQRPSTSLGTNGVGVHSSMSGLSAEIGSK